MIYFILYLLIVIGGWLDLRPQPLQANWTLLYQVPTNIFIFIDRLLNVTIVSLIILAVPAWRKKSPVRWETISGRIGRDFQGSIAEVLINIVLLDWGSAYSPGHCERYKGV